MTVGTQLPDPSAPGLWSAPASAASCVLLIAGTILALWPVTNGPFLPGDDYRFIVDNATVHELSWSSLQRIFTSMHGDLYQPIPLLSAAVDWVLWRGDPFGFRLSEIVLHSLNAALLWWLFRSLTRSDWTAVCTATLWALHPIHIRTYTGDFARTHLWAGFFFLLCLLFYRASDGGRRPWFYIAALTMAALELMSKPIIGLVGVLALMDWIGGHRRPMGLFLRLAPFMVMGLVVSLVTIQGSAAFGLIGDVSESLLGSPWSRAGAAIALYARNIACPLWLSAWYLQPPNFSGRSAEVWIGAVIFLASILLMIAAWRRRLNVTLGVGWFWCTLLQSLGFFGERNAVGNDAYLYQPLMGLALTLTAAMVPNDIRGENRSSGRRWLAAGLILLGAYSVLAAFAVRSILPNFADILGRAEHVAELYSRDPRAHENLGMAYRFVRLYPASDTTPEQTDLYRMREIDSFRRAGLVPDVRDYYPSQVPCARFLLRIATRLNDVEDRNSALATADRVMTLTPLEDGTALEYARWLGSHGYIDRALMTYQRLLVSRPNNYGLRREVGDVLLSAGLAAEAAQWYAEALLRQENDVPSLLGAAAANLALDQVADASNFAAKVRWIDSTEMTAKAILGRALLRQGERQEASRLATEILIADPRHPQGRLLFAELMLASESPWEALKLFGEILDQDSTNFDALRGFHKAAIQSGEPEQSRRRWNKAKQLKPWHVGIGSGPDQESELSSKKKKPP